MSSLTRPSPRRLPTPTVLSAVRGVPVAHLPREILAGVTLAALMSLIDVAALRELWRMRRSEFWVAAVACLTVLTLGALRGVIIAFLLSLIDLIWRASRPYTSVPADLPGGEGFDDAPAGAPVQMTRPGLVIYRFGAALYFANARRFQDEVTALVAEARPALRGGRVVAAGARAAQAKGPARATRRAHSPGADPEEAAEEQQGRPEGQQQGPERRAVLLQRLCLDGGCGYHRSGTGRTG